MRSIGTPVVRCVESVGHVQEKPCQRLCPESTIGLHLLSGLE